MAQSNGPKHYLFPTCFFGSSDSLTQVTLSFFGINITDPLVSKKCFCSIITTVISGHELNSGRGFGHLQISFLTSERNIAYQLVLASAIHV